MRRTVSISLAAVVLVCSITASAAAADEGPGISPAVMACAKKALSSGDLKALAQGDLDQMSPSGYAAAFTCNSTGGKTSSVKIDPKARIITSSPFDPAPVTTLSKFRSCAGHDYSGRNISGKPESQRSMKTYVDTSTPVTSAHAITAVAPFAGTVTIAPTANDYGKQLTITSPKGWVFTYFHGDPTVRVGAKVRAGQPVIQLPPAAVNSQEGQSTATFDMALMTVDGRRDNVFAHMAPAAAAPWAARGFTAESTTFTQAERDAAPCTDFSPATDHFVQAK